MTDRYKVERVRRTARSGERHSLLDSIGAIYLLYSAAIAVASLVSWLLAGLARMPVAAGIAIWALIAVDLVLIVYGRHKQGLWMGLTELGVLLFALVLAGIFLARSEALSHKQPHDELELLGATVNWVLTHVLPWVIAAGCLFVTTTRVFPDEGENSSSDARIGAEGGSGS